MYWKDKQLCNFLIMKNNMSKISYLTFLIELLQASKSKKIALKLE